MPPAFSGFRCQAMPKGMEVDRPEESASSAGDSKKAKEKEKKGKKSSWAAGRNRSK